MGKLISMPSSCNHQCKKIGVDLIKFKSTISIYNIYASIKTGFLSFNVSREINRFNRGYDKGSLKHKLFFVWDTPHAKYLLKNKSPYTRYVKKTRQLDHTAEIFDDLIDKYSPCKSKVDLIYREGFFVITDGVHRMAIDFNKRNLKIYDLLSFEINNGKFAPAIENEIDLSPCKDQILKKFKSTKGVYFNENGWGVSSLFPSGYHSLTSFGLNISGQRDCSKRISKIESFIEINGKAILDIGCNTGGMLFNIDDPALAYGLDFDGKAIDAANFLKKTLCDAGWHEYSRRFIFEKINLDRVDLTKLFNRMSRFAFDIIFLGSIGSWVRSWKNVYKMAVMLAPLTVFEENNSDEGCAQLSYFESLGCKCIKIIEGSDDDATGNHSRNTYLIYSPFYMNENCPEDNIFVVKT